MFRLPSVLAAALGLSVIIAPQPARARGVQLPTGTLSVVASVNGVAATNPAVRSGEDILEVTFNYTITSAPAGTTVHMEVAACSPLLDPFTIGVSGTTTRLDSCSDGNGNTANVIVGPSFSALQGSTGVTGIFTAYITNAYGITPNNTSFEVDGALIEDSTTGGISTTVIANAEVRGTIVAAQTPSIEKRFVSVTTGQQPGGTEPGYLVTWSVTLENDASNSGSANTDGVYLSGTTTVTDAVPAGVIYTAGSFDASALSGDLQSIGPTYVTANLNNTPTITTPSSSVTSIVMTLNNLLSVPNGVTPVFYYTEWYPTSTVTASNTATATFPNNTNDSSTATVYLGAGSGSLAKEHLCPQPLESTGQIGYSSLNAFHPTPQSNLECAWDPSAPAEFRLTASAVQPAGSPNPGQAQPIADPVVTDVLPPNLILRSLNGIYLESDTSKQSDLTSQWTLQGSADSGCSATSGSFIAISSSTPSATLATLRCIRYSFSGFTTAAQMYYTAVLASSDAATLEATPGSYEVVTNTSYLSATDLPTTYVTSLDTTFWSSREPALSVDPIQGSVGTDVLVTAQAPTVGNVEVANSEGYTDLTFGCAALPLEIDVTGTPTLTPGAPVPVEDDDATTATPVCTFASQVHNANGTISPASWQCTLPGHIPSYTQNPYTDPSCHAPDFCYASGYLPPWNIANVTVPERIVAGSQGEFVNITCQVWSNVGTIGSGGIAPPGTSAANPVQAFTSAFISGSPQLRVSNSTPSTSIPSGSTISYFIDYSNSGTVTTTDTYVYDLFGLNPLTGDKLSQDFAAQGCSASDSPTLVSVSHVSGTPSSTAEYTTDAVPGPSGNWTAPRPRTSPRSPEFASS